MLKNLQIQNYALIDDLEINFQEGLNIITGETGAGKSILLGALSLILGQRADTSVLRDKSKSCIVEGLFNIKQYSLKEFFAENDIDYQDQTIVRRQINESGKSRAFINEIPVNLNTLKEFGSLIIDIHSQHENLLLGSNLFQLRVLDAFASIQNEVEEYQSEFILYKKIKSEFEILTNDSNQSRKELDYLKFQLDELIQAKLKPNELPELEIRQKELTHASEIKEALQQITLLLDNDSSSSISILRDAETLLKRTAPFFSHASDLIKRIESCRIELKDLAVEANNLFEQIDIDPSILDEVTKRLNLIYSLLQKHRLGTTNELITLRDELEQKVLYINNLDFNIDKKQKELEEHRNLLVSKVEKLNGLRVKAIPALEKDITDLLVQLGIKYPAFKVKVDRLDDFQSYGTDKVTFYFSANKQIGVQELSRVASGGELSRLMLSLKSLMLKSSELPTIIFDEIDAGVSGDIADKMGNIINRMAGKMQVINITHLPQIASKGRYHYLVYKDNRKSQTSTRIKLLSSDERIVEVAKMLSGEKVTDAALMNARELLSSNGN